MGNKENEKLMSIMLLCADCFVNRDKSVMMIRNLSNGAIFI